MTALLIVAALGELAAAAGLFLAQRGGRELRRSTLLGFGVLNLAMFVLLVVALALSTT